MSVSGSVSDLMRDIPSVQVDVEGNVSLRGSGSVGRVVGAPSRMDADNLAFVRPRQRGDDGLLDGVPHAPCFVCH